MGDYFVRHRLNPVEELKRLGWPHEHVTFDPALSRGRYYIRRASAHDGTLIFHVELLARTLIDVAFQGSYCTRDDVDFARLRGVRYRVGWLRNCAVIGMVDLPVGRYPGEREAMRMQVVPEYVY